MQSESSVVQARRNGKVCAGNDVADNARVLLDVPAISITGCSLDLCLLSGPWTSRSITLRFCAATAGEAQYGKAKQSRCQ